MILQKVKTRINEIDISAAELGRKSGIGKSQLSKWLNGKCEFRQESIEKICKVLNLELKPVDNE